MVPMTPSPIQMTKKPPISPRYLAARERRTPPVTSGNPL
jgi:hypothetical protein